ncbi:MAG TPA: type II toxin-antitoxin system HicA family toxin [Phycisphaerales bacterium]|nr:type II toxin-antitoxin system HicA family toxin [Phycisphaerales bacterium]HMP38018.1 type II toxin-antitoxin system HicA family toxin [Phycisphaerales bacterium]
MKLPRDIPGLASARALTRIGYAVDHQRGSHIRRSTQHPSPHSITVPAHGRLKVVTLSGVLRELATHAHLERDKLLPKLFERSDHGDGAALTRRGLDVRSIMYVTERNSRRDAG